MKKPKNIGQQHIKTVNALLKNMVRIDVCAPEHKKTNVMRQGKGKAFLKRNYKQPELHKA